MSQVKQTYAEKRKAHIIATALPVFAEKGFSAVSMKDIMLAAEISRGDLYAHYENIAAVFFDALKFADQNQLTTLLTVDTNQPRLPQLLNWFDRIMASLAEPNLIKSKTKFFLAYADVDIPYLKERYQELRQTLISFVTAGVKLGEFNLQL